MEESIKEYIIHQGVLVCFDFYDDYLEYPKDKSYDWSENQDNFESIAALTKEIIEYIEKHNLSKENFGNEYKKELLNNKDYIILSILGNKIEYLMLK